MNTESQWPLRAITKNWLCMQLEPVSQSAGQPSTSCIFVRCTSPLVRRHMAGKSSRDIPSWTGVNYPKVRHAIIPCGFTSPWRGLTLVCMCVLLQLSQAQKEQIAALKAAGLATNVDEALAKILTYKLGCLESYAVTALRDYSAHFSIDASFLGTTPAGWCVGEQIIAGCAIFEPKAQQIRSLLEAAPRTFLSRPADVGAVIFVHGILHSSTGRLALTRSLVELLVVPTHEPTPLRHRETL